MTWGTSLAGPLLVAFLTREEEEEEEDEEGEEAG